LAVLVEGDGLDLETNVGIRPFLIPDIINACRVEIEFTLATLNLIAPRGPAVNKRKPLFIVHDTADGLVYGQTVKLPNGKWLARNWGNELQGTRECKTMREANDHLLTAFREMFLEHRLMFRVRGPASRSWINHRPVHGNDHDHQALNVQREIGVRTFE
jgi:hypothetical protein